MCAGEDSARTSAGRSNRRLLHSLCHRSSARRPHNSQLRTTVHVTLLVHHRLKIEKLRARWTVTTTAKQPLQIYAHKTGGVALCLIRWCPTVLCRCHLLHDHIDNCPFFTKNWHLWPIFPLFTVKQWNVAQQCFLVSFSNNFWRIPKCFLGL